MPAKKVTKSVSKTSIKKVSKTSTVEVKVPAVKAAAKITKSKTANLSVLVYSLASGRESGKLDLPKEYFGGKVNKALLAQALRVYLNNQKSHWSSTKTRGEVEGSTRKIYKQKGTGRARHGGIRAPIFVGGGIALGPKSRKVTLDLPKKMKQASLISALSEKAQSGQISGLSGAEKSTGKTKEIAGLLKKINSNSALIIVDKRQENLERAVKNIKNISIEVVRNINTFEVIRYKNLLLTKEALNVLTGVKDA